MRICDICKKNGVRYETYATTSEDGDGYKLELCGSCYMKLQQKKCYHDYLSYKETVEEITGETPKKKSWWNIFNKENRPC
jgi:ribosome-binding protein aMBF1 (putative translation factor)